MRSFYYCINIFGQICLFFLLLFALRPLRPPILVTPSALVGYLADPRPYVYR